MPRKSHKRPTDAELAILRVLWDRGASTVREVFQALDGQTDVGYTTVLKTMQIMTEKRLLERDETQRAHVYQPVLAEEITQQQLVGDLLDRAFHGSSARLVLQALSSHQATPAEIAEIRRLLDQMQDS